MKIEQLTFAFILQWNLYSQSQNVIISHWHHHWAFHFRKKLLRQKATISQGFVRTKKILQLYHQRPCSSQPSRCNTGFTTWEAAFRHLNWTSGPRGALISCGLLGVLFQRICQNNQRVHVYEIEGVRPADLTSPVLLTPFPLPSEDKPQTAACEVLRAQ